jgi:TolB protein
MGELQQAGNGCGQGFIKAFSTFGVTIEQIMNITWPMRASLLNFSLLLAASIAAAFAAEPARKIAFERDGVIFTAGLDGKGVKKLAQGDLPQISPDGASVAFTSNEPGDKLPVRHIAIADLATGKVNVLKSVPSDNSFGPAWSPDSKSLLFSIFTKDEWQLALINADGTGFRIAKKSEDKGQSCYEPCWAADGESFFCHDLDAIYRLDLDGKLIKQWAIHDIVTNGDMSSNCRLSVSPDGKSLLMDIEMGEDHNRSNWDGPPPALWLLDLNAEKATRLTKKNVFAWDSCWISNEEYLFLSQGPKETKPSLYRGSIKGSEPKLIAKGARTPSVSR